MSRMIQTLVMMTALGSSFVWGQGAAAQNPVNAERDALRTDGLQGAARLRGHYTAPYVHNEWRQLTLTDLVRESDLIVKGTVQKESVELAEGHELTITKFHITPARVEKGVEADLNDKFLRVPGGKVTFPDETTAEIVNPLCQILTADRSEYWFFLKSVSGGYELVGDSQGIIQVDNMSVKSLARSIDPIVDEVSKYSANALDAKLNEISK